MTNPYFYIIEHVPSGRYYAGVRYAKGCDVVELLADGGYMTSSTVVKAIIDDEGKDNFIVRKTKTFECANEALQYETRFLKKVRAATNRRFLNIGENIRLPFNSEPFINAMFIKYGVEYPSQSPTIKERQKQSHHDRYGDYFLNSEQGKDAIKQTLLNRYGTDNPMKFEDTKQKYRETCLERYGVDHPWKCEGGLELKKSQMHKKYGVEHALQHEEFKAKQRQTNMDKLGVPYPMQDEEVRQKSKTTCLDKYGVGNISQCDEIKALKAEKTAQKNNRDLVKKIRQMKRPKGYSIGRGWYLKSDEFLQEVYEFLLKHQ